MKNFLNYTLTTSTSWLFIKYGDKTSIFANIVRRIAHSEVIREMLVVLVTGLSLIAAQALVGWISSKLKGLSKGTDDAIDKLEDDLTNIKPKDKKKK